LPTNQKAGSRVSSGAPFYKGKYESQLAAGGLVYLRTEIVSLAYRWRIRQKIDYLVAGMKTKTKLTAVLMLAITAAIVAVAQQQSLTGVISDSMCTATHIAKDTTPAECT
jgi:hypothetical protein